MFRPSIPILYRALLWKCSDNFGKTTIHNDKSAVCSLPGGPPCPLSRFLCLQLGSWPRHSRHRQLPRIVCWRSLSRAARSGPFASARSDNTPVYAHTCRQHTCVCTYMLSTHLCMHIHLITRNAVLFYGKCSGVLPRIQCSGVLPRIPGSLADSIGRLAWEWDTHWRESETHTHTHTHTQYRAFCVDTQPQHSPSLAGAHHLTPICFAKNTGLFCRRYRAPLSNAGLFCREYRVVCRE